MKRVANCATLMGSAVMVTGIGSVSINVIFSRGRVESSETGSSAGERARTTCRR
jgi:hypothetical protein